METFSALLAICAGNSPVPGEFPTQRPVTRSFGVFFDLRLDKRLRKQSWGWWFETPRGLLWRHRNASCRNSISYISIGNINDILVKTGEFMWYLRFELSDHSRNYILDIKIHDISWEVSHTHDITCICVVFHIVVRDIILREELDETFKRHVSLAEKFFLSIYDIS